jgi:hypothetical protein
MKVVDRFAKKRKVLTVSLMKKYIYSALMLIGCFVNYSVFADSCQQGDSTHIWISPRVIKAGKPVKVMAVSSSQVLTELVLTLPNGEKQPLTATANNGLPHYVSAQIDQLGEGHYQLEVKENNETLACREVFNGDHDKQASSAWNEDYEVFYSAWIEQLFDSPVSENLSFPSLEPVLRDSERNFLHNHFGLNEDKGVPATPDCADFPYFLRSYFAWKNGLPFNFRSCNRGSAKKPPSCSSAIIRTDFVKNTASLATFNALNNTLMNAVQSGNGRTGLSSEETDFYPLALKREVLLPGTIYADPYGHGLMLTKWVPQTENSAGILFAVDAQPDNSIARKRFWEGTFLFANVASAGPGFKAFRPIANNRLLKNNQLANYSTEQANLTPEAFYAQIYQLINPNGLDARQAYEATLTALVEQLETRVQSVENGEAYFHKGGRTIEMPKGAAIFETVGAWEDFATPSRDMRLLIAMNVLLNFPEKILKFPELFNLTTDSASQVKRQIEELHEKLIHQKTIHYVRSNGEPWQLTVAEILERKPAFEMSYNPNDCVEVRWGAKENTEEYASCKRHAPAAQLKQMAAVRDWFRDTKRPSR